MTVITRVALTETEPTKTNSAINQIAEYIDTNASVWANIKVKIGSFTRDISLATGTQAVTGVGFQPKAVIFMAGSTTQVTDNSIGFDDGTNKGCLVSFNAITTGTAFSNAAFSIFFQQANPNTYTGIVQSLDTDGFTISWTKTSSPTGTRTIAYLAIA